MNDTVGIDSNTLTYLVESMDPGYNPTTDISNLADERISLLRIYLYGGVPYYIVPTVTKEYQKIKIKLKKDTHESLCKILLLDELWNIAEDDLIARMTEITKYHNKNNDCRIVAEAELGGLKVLLTCDADIQKRLSSKAKVNIMSPSDYWTNLSISHGSQPVFSPHNSNPLYGKSWWRW